MPTYQGGCHCGRVRFEVTAQIDEAIDCNCSICTKKGFLHLIVEPEQFRLLTPQDAVAVYQFNTRTAKHYMGFSEEFCLLTSRGVRRMDSGKSTLNPLIMGIGQNCTKTPPI